MDTRRCRCRKEGSTMHSNRLLLAAHGRRAAAGLLAVCGVARGDAQLQNGGFETTHTVTGAPHPDQGFGVWRLGADGKATTHWTLNPAFPGELAVLSDGAHSGDNFIRLRATGKRGQAHSYQPCASLEVGKWYVVRAWVRGGSATLLFYEYYKDGTMKFPSVVAASAGADKWGEVLGYYLCGGPGFTSASLAIVVEAGKSVDVDDVRIEEAPEMSRPDGLQPVVIENELTRIVLSPRGLLQEFVARKSGVNYAPTDGAVPMFSASRGGGEVPVSFIERKGEQLVIHFVDPKLEATLKVASARRYFTFTVERASADLDWLQLCDLRLNLAESVGTLVNAAWDKDFAACALACNDLTHSYGADGSRAALCARCYREFGVQGAKVAIIGAPQKQLLEVIEEVEFGEGLPHPVLNGKWIKRAPERFASYLMSHSVGEHNIDQVLEFAKGGFGCIELYPWHSTPTYGINRDLFPKGLAGLKEVADKIHAAGLQLGLHTMQAMVGWGRKDDPYVSPKADPRLLQDRHAALAAAMDAKTIGVAAKESVADWPDKGDLFVEGEIIRYTRRTDTGFAECQRGLHGTTAAAHAAGTPVGLLVNCFGMWGNVVYAPDVKSTMVDEVCENLARVFNETGCDMAYFDGGEEVAVQPPHWRNQGRVALGVMQRLKKPVILEGNALYTNLSWHVITRGSPSYDPIYFGRREYTLRAKGQNPLNWAKDLFTGDVGWFAPHVQSLSTDAVTPDEVSLLCLKALGGKAPISFHVDANNPYANKRMPEMLDLIRTCDELKRREHFSDEVCAELTKPMAEHTLEQTAAGAWTVSPMAFGPPVTLNARRPERSEWSYSNPHAEQQPWLRLRARAALAPYGAKENLVLADFGGAIPFKPDGADSADLVHAAEPAAERTPDGSAAFCYRAQNKAKAPSSWCRLSLPFDPPRDLSTHRRVGVWVKAEGKGGLLNVQLANTYGYRDHYIPLDFTGWSYRELDPPEDTRFYQYRWPYNFVDLMYWVFQYNQVTGVNLYYNALPPEAETSCLIGRIEALQELALPLRSPALEVGGKKLTFPVSLRPDEYVELDWQGKSRHFEPNGGLIQEVRPEGNLVLGAGDNAVKLTGEVSDVTSPRAEVTLATKGRPLQNPPVKAAGAKPAIRKTGDELRLEPGGSRGLRLMRGLHELVGREPPRSLAAFDGVGNVWTVANESTTPARAAVAILRGTDSPDVDYADPRGIVLETFDDLTAYEMSDTNQFEKYVVGGGKQLTKDGPAREGVSQTFVPSTEGAQAGKSCGVYSAANNGGPGGWCGKGRRFPKPLDLSGYAAVALWVHGDGKREALRFQFADVAGRYADWVVRIDFTGWRLLVFRTADAKGFDWAKTDYLLFYFNDIPAKGAVTLRFDDVKALPKLSQPPLLARPVLTLNGKSLRLPADLAPGEGLAVDTDGTCAVWRPGAKPGKSLKVKGASLLLQPGENRFELSCDTAQGAPRDVTVRVVGLGPRASSGATVGR
jgi:hypothetical protein